MAEQMPGLGDVSKGILKGEIYFKGNLRGSQSEQSEPALEEEKPLNREQILKLMFPDRRVMEATNLRTSFEMLMDQTQTSWELFDSADKITPQVQAIALNIATKHLNTVLRLTGGDWKKNLELCKNEFRSSFLQILH